MDFVEVHLNCSHDRGMKSDPKAPYKKTRAGRITDMMGVAGFA